MTQVVFGGFLIVSLIHSGLTQVESLEPSMHAVDLLNIKVNGCEQSLGIYPIQLPPEPSPFIEPEVLSVRPVRPSRESEKDAWLRTRNSEHASAKVAAAVWRKPIRRWAGRLY